MRISDWSSDVCSSDLDLCIDPHCPTRVTVSSGYAVDCCGDDLVLCDTGCIDLRDCCPDPCLPAETDQSQAEKIEKRFDQEMAERLGIEIGRASCRERVCQVRVVLGGCRHIKKKKKNKNHK